MIKVSNCSGSWPNPCRVRWRETFFNLQYLYLCICLSFHIYVYVFMYVVSVIVVVIKEILGLFERVERK